MTKQDPLAEVAALPGVAAAVAAARAAIDPLLLDRRLRTHGAALAEIATLRNAHASATLEGAEIPLEELQAGSADSPLSRVAFGAVEVQRSIRTHLGAPVRQVWASMATVAGREYLDETRRGRPRTADELANDPLHTGIAYDADDVAVRLAMVVELLQQPTKAPALVVAAIAHGELLATQPFGAGNGVVARAYAQLITAQRGLDPDLLCMMDVGLMSLGRSAYVRAIRDYDTGGAEGVANWVTHIASAFERGGAVARDVLETLVA